MAKANKLLTTAHLMALFAVSHMAIQHWRKAADPLPTETVDDNPRAVGFLPGKVKAWAKKHGKEMTVKEPADLLGTDVADKPAAKKEAKPAAKKVDARTGKVLAPLKPSKPVAKKAATAIHQKKVPAKKVSPLKGTKVSAKKTPEVQVDPAPVKPRRAIAQEAVPA